MKTIRGKTITKSILVTVLISIICGIIAMILLIMYRRGYFTEYELGFIGSIAGGGITLIGVYFTISFNLDIHKSAKAEQDLLEKTKLSIEYKPVIQIVDKKINVDSKWYKSDNLNEGEHKDDPNIALIIPIRITLKNIGRGEITSGKIYAEYADDHIMNLYSQTLENIFPEDSFEINTGFALQEVLVAAEQNYCTTIPYTITYYDCVDKEYNVELPIKIKVLKDNFKKQGFKVEVNIDGINRNIKKS